MQAIRRKEKFKEKWGGLEKKKEPDEEKKNREKEGVGNKPPFNFHLFIV